MSCSNHLLNELNLCNIPYFEIIIFHPASGDNNATTSSNIRNNAEAMHVFP